MNYHYIVVDLIKKEVVKRGKKAKIFDSTISAEVWCQQHLLEDYEILKV